MFHFNRIVVLVAALFAVTSGAAAQQGATTPKPGSAERRAIMDALRPPVMADLNQRVVFRVAHLKVQGGWAFMTARPIQPDGRKVDYRKSKFAEAWKGGALEDEVAALLRRGPKGWSVTRYSIGATDVVWHGWWQTHKAPRAIFPR